LSLDACLRLLDQLAIPDGHQEGGSVRQLIDGGAVWGALFAAQGARSARPFDFLKGPHSFLEKGWNSDPAITGPLFSSPANFFVRKKEVHLILSAHTAGNAFRPPSHLAEPSPRSRRHYAIFPKPASTIRRFSTPASNNRPHRPYR
jgi:hypothetical protein